MLWRDIIRPFYGLLMVQPPILLFFILTTDDWWYDYLHVGWPLNLMVTIWLIPCYAYYERWWNKRQTEPSYSHTES